MRRFLDVTLPQLKEVLIVVIVFRTIWTFNKFEEIYLLTKGGPGTSTFNLAVYSFEQSIANLRLGVGAATGVVMMVMLLAGQHRLSARVGLRRGREGTMSTIELLDAGEATRILRASLCGHLRRLFPAGLGALDLAEAQIGDFRHAADAGPAGTDAGKLRGAAHRPAAIFPVRRPAGDVGDHPGPVLHALVRQQHDRHARLHADQHHRLDARRLQPHALPLLGAHAGAVLQPARLHGAVDHLRLPAVPGHGAARPDGHAAQPRARLRLHHAAVLHVADVGLHALDPDRDRGGRADRRRLAPAGVRGRWCCRLRCPASSPRRSSP